MIVLTKIQNEDIKQVANVHLNAFKGFINTLAGKKYVEKFIEWFTINNDCIALVVKDDSKCIGYVVGAKVGYQKKINRDLLFVAFIGLLKNPMALLNAKLLNNIWQRLLILVKKKEEIKENANILHGKVVSLVGIAVLNEYKGKSIASQLINEFEYEAKNQKFDFMRLSVHTINTRARKFYENNGWLFLEYSSKDVVYYYKKIKSSL